MKWFVGDQEVGVFYGKLGNNILTESPEMSGILGPTLCESSWVSSSTAYYHTVGLFV